MKSELQVIPGIGKALSRDLQYIGIHRIADLKKKDPNKLYERLCEKRGRKLDPCILYAFRCAVYYASNKKHKPDKLKWWNWKI